MRGKNKFKEKGHKFTRKIKKNSEKNVIHLREIINTYTRKIEYISEKKSINL